VRQRLKARFVDINDLSLFDVLHPLRVPKPEDDFGMQQIRGHLKSTGRTSRKVVSAILRCFQTQLCPSMRCTRSWCGSVAGKGGGKSDEDVYEVIIMDDSLGKLLPDLVILIEIEGVQWLETATCEGGFSLRTQTLTAQRHRMGDSLLPDDLLQRPIVA
jgi:hypothetical protein